MDASLGYALAVLAASVSSPVISRRSEGQLGAWPSVHPVLARVYAARGITSPEQIEDRLEHLEHWKSLGGIKEAAELLKVAIEQSQKIVVIGDFDADGATASALAVRTLKQFGAEVDFLVPNRFEYGYGLTTAIVEQACERFAPALIMTVDNGVSSHEGVAAARARGIRVIITDHHLAGATLPDADVIVNPNLPGDTFPSKSLAGVGVVFYLMLALRQVMASDIALAEVLDLVALGTVADVVPLDRNNRILVAQGLRRIRAGRCRPGITALLREAGRNPSDVTAADLAFAVAPRLNAAGRLEDMTIGIDCLMSDDPDTAQRLAGSLSAINQERREIEQAMQADAMRVVDRLPDSQGPVGVCLFDPAWHQGVVGIVASRVKDRLHRPVIAFARSGDGEIKGSARSIGGFHVRDALDTVAARYPALLQKFGGHAMAAGLSLREQDYERFAAAFDEVARERLDDAALEQHILTDGELPAAELELVLAEAIRAGGPWGHGFPEPLFDGEFNIVERRVLQTRHLKMRVQPLGSDRVFDAIAFGADPSMLENTPDQARLVYKLDVNAWQGNRHLQLLVERMVK